MASRVRNLGSLSVSLTAEAEMFFRIMKNAEKSILSFNSAVKRAANSTAQVLKEAGIDKQLIPKTLEAQGLGEIAKQTANLTTTVTRLTGVLGEMGLKLKSVFETKTNEAAKATSSATAKIRKDIIDTRAVFDDFKKVTDANRNRAFSNKNIAAVKEFSGKSKSGVQGNTRIEQIRGGLLEPPTLIAKSGKALVEEYNRVYGRINSLFAERLAARREQLNAGQITEEKFAAEEKAILAKRVETVQRFDAIVKAIRSRDTGGIFGDGKLRTDGQSVVFEALPNAANGLIKLTDGLVRYTAASKNAAGVSAIFAEAQGALERSVKKSADAQEALLASGNFGDAFLKQAPQNIQNSFENIDRVITKATASLGNLQTKLSSGGLSQEVKTQYEDLGNKLSSALDNLIRYREELVKSAGTDITTPGPEFNKSLKDLKRNADDVSQSQKKLQRELDKTDKSSRELGGSFLRLSSLFRNITSGSSGVISVFKNLANSIDFTLGAITEFFIARQILNGFLTTLRLVTNAFPAFEDAIQQVAAIVGGDEASLTRNIEKLSKAARQLARDTIVPVTEAAKALQILSQAGLSASEATKALEPVIAISVGGVSSLDEAARIATSTMKAFRLESEDLSDVANVLVATVNNSKSTIEDLNTAFNFAGSTAATVGLRYQDLAAIVGTLADNGVRASTQGTTVRRVISSLLEPTKKAREVFAELGVSLSDLNPISNDIGDILIRLKDAGFSAEDAFRAFDERAAAAASLLVQNADKFRELNTKVTGTQAAFQAMERRQESLSAKFKIIYNNINDLAISFGEKLAPAAHLATDGLKLFIDGVEYALPRVKALTIALTGLSLAIAGGMLLNIKNLTTGFDLLTRAVKFALIPLRAAFSFFSKHPVLAALTGVLYIAAEAWNAHTASVEKDREERERLDEVVEKNEQALTDFTETVKTNISVLEKAEPGTVKYAHALNQIDAALFDLLGRFPQLVDQAREFTDLINSGDFSGALQQLNSFTAVAGLVGPQNKTLEQAQKEALGSIITEANKAALELGADISKGTEDAHEGRVKLLDQTSRKIADVIFTEEKQNLKNTIFNTAAIGIAIRKYALGELQGQTIEDAILDAIDLEDTGFKPFAAGSAEARRREGLKKVIESPEFKQKIKGAAGILSGVEKEVKKGQSRTKITGIAPGEIKDLEEEQRVNAARLEAEKEATRLGLALGDKRRKAFIDERIAVEDLKTSFGDFLTKVGGVKGLEPLAEAFQKGLPDVKNFDQFIEFVDKVQEKTDEATNKRLEANYAGFKRSAQLQKEIAQSERDIAGLQDQGRGAKRVSDEKIALIKAEGAERRRTLLESLVGARDEASFNKIINSLIENRFETETKIANLKTGEERQLALQEVEASRILEAETERANVLKEAQDYYENIRQTLDNTLETQTAIAKLELQIEQELRKTRRVSGSKSKEEQEDTLKELEIERQSKQVEINNQEQTITEKRLALSAAEQSASSILIQQAQNALLTEENKLKVLEKQLALINAQIAAAKNQNQVLINIGDTVSNIIEDAFEGAILDSKKLDFKQIFQSAKESFVKQMTKGFAEVLVKKLGFDKEFDLNFFNLGQKAGQNIEKGVTEKGFDKLVDGAKNLGSKITDGLGNLFGGGGPSSVTSQETEANYLRSLGQTVPEGVEIVGPSENFAPTEDLTGKTKQVEADAATAETAEAAQGAAKALQTFQIVLTAAGITAQAFTSALNEAGKIKDVVPGKEGKDVAGNTKVASGVAVATGAITGAALGATVGAAALGIGAIPGAAIGAAIGATITSAISKEISGQVRGATKDAIGKGLSQEELNKQVSEDIIVKIATAGLNNEGEALQKIGLIPNIERVFDEILKKLVKDATGKNLDLDLRGQLGSGLSGKAKERSFEFFGEGTQGRTNTGALAQLLAAKTGAGAANIERINRYFSILANNAAKFRDNMEDANKYILEIAKGLFKGEFGRFYRFIEQNFRSKNEVVTGSFTRQVNLLKEAFKESFPLTDIDTIVDQLIITGASRGLGPKRFKASREAVTEAAEAFKSRADFDVAFSDFAQSLKDTVKSSIIGGFTDAFITSGPIGVVLDGFFGKLQKAIKKAAKKGDFSEETLNELVRIASEQANVTSVVLTASRAELERMFEIAKEVEKILDDIIKTPVQKEQERLSALKQVMDTIASAADAVFATIKQTADYAARFEQLRFDATTGESSPNQAPGIPDIFKGAAEKAVGKFFELTEGLTPAGLAGQAQFVLGLGESALDSLDTWLDASLTAITEKFEPAIRLAESAASALEGVQSSLQNILLGRSDISPSEKLASIDQSIKEQRDIMLTGTPEEQIEAAAKLQQLLTQKLDTSAQLLDTSGPIYRGIVNDVTDELTSLSEFLRDNFGDPEDLQKQMEEEIKGARQEAFNYYEDIRAALLPWIEEAEKLAADQFTQLEELLRETLGVPEGASLAEILAAAFQASTDTLLTFLEKAGIIEAGGDPNKLPEAGSGGEKATRDLLTTKTGRTLETRVKNLFPEEEVTIPGHELKIALNRGMDALYNQLDDKKKSKVEAGFLGIISKINNLTLPGQIDFKIVAQGIAWLQSIIGELGFSFLDDKVSLKDKFGVAIVDYIKSVIPALGDGGLAVSELFARIGERGPEAVLPLSGPVMMQLADAILDSIDSRSASSIISRSGALDIGKPTAIFGNSQGVNLTVEVMPGAFNTVVNGGNTEEIKRLPEKQMEALEHSFRYGRLRKVIKEIQQGTL